MYVSSVVFCEKLAYFPAFPVKDFDKEGWKIRQLFTEYYTANLHVGAFMLPKYVEDILEEEEGKK